MKYLSKFLTLSGLIWAALISLATPSVWAIPQGAAELLQFEQKYNDRSMDNTKVFASNNFQDKQFSPEQGNIFRIKSYWLPADELNVFEVPQGIQKLGLPLYRRFYGQDQVLFLIHPESESFYSYFTSTAERGPDFEATATASARTVLAWPKSDPNKVFFAKLSLNKNIGGVVRTIPKGEVARSIGTTRILDASRAELPSNFEYLPEVFGAIPKGMDRGGLILRTIPESVLSGQKRWMPLFSLYSRPNPGSASPLEKMLKASQTSPSELIKEKILRPFAKQWLELVVQHGIAIEAHAQNVLMEIDSLGNPTGKFLFRDFGGFNVDLKFRRDLDKPMPLELPVITDENSDYHQKYHQKALQQSLEVYFEAGFLFGLGKELVQLGHPELDYQSLKVLFRSELLASFSSAEIHPSSKDFYQRLLKTIESRRPLSCKAVFRKI